MSSLTSWKYSKERLLKHKYCAHVINAKKVICICGKTIKLNRRYEEDYLNRHAKSSGCKAREGQRTIYNFYKSAKVQNIESSEDEFDSDIYDNMDDDDLLKIDESSENDDNISVSTIISDDENMDQHSKKRQTCKGLRSEQISLYIKRTPAQFGGSRRVEIIACELFPKFLGKKFSRKKLNFEEKRKLNRALYAESVWQIDRSCKLI
jgi:hypothetical protein